jgi:hypothetical protein
MKRTEKSRRDHWIGGAFDDDRITARMAFPGFGPLKAAFPVNCQISKKWPADVEQVILVPAGASAIPAALVDDIIATLRNGGGIALFAANKFDLDSCVAEIKAASALADLCGINSVGRR